MPVELGLLDRLEVRTAAGEVLTLSADTMLFDEGLQDGSCGLLLVGRIELSLDQRPVEVLEAPAMIGAMQLLGDSRRRYTARVLESAELAVFDRRAYEARRGAGEELAWVLEGHTLVTLSRHLRHLDVWLAELRQNVEMNYPLPDLSPLTQFRRLLADSPVRWLDTHAALVDSGAFVEARDEAVQQLAEQATARAYEPGEMVFVEGGVSDGVYLLVSGRLEAVIATDRIGRFRVLGDVKPGMVFGMTSLLEDKPHLATMVAAEPSAVVKIPANVWLQLIQREDQLGSGVRRAGIRCLAELVDSAHDQILDLSGVIFRDVDETTGEIPFD